MVTFYLFISLIFLFVIAIIWISIDFLINKSKSHDEPNNKIQPDIHDHEDSIILVQPGGRIINCSNNAKALFKIPEYEKLTFRDLEESTDIHDLYKVINNPGKVSLKINDQTFEVHSYSTTDGMLLSFQPVKATGEEIIVDEDLNQKIFPILESLSKSHDFDQVLNVFFEEIRNIFQCDYVELGFINEIQEEIEIFSSTKLESNNALISKSTCHMENCFIGVVCQKNQKIYIEDITTKQFKFNDKLIDLHIRQLLGLPIILGDQSIGAVVFGKKGKIELLEIENFTSSTYWKQLEIILHNAWITKRLNRKSSELSGLSKLSVSFSHIKNPQELIQTILTNYGHLLPIEIFGFILFNDRTQILEAMKPFQGLPDPIVEIIRNKVEPESPAEKILNSQDILLFDNAMDNPQWGDLGLSHLANAASIKEAVLIPLAQGNDPMGFLLAANHNNDTSSFTQDEIHSLMIIANQTAPLIENLFLLLQSKQRTQQAELLRRISSIANSNATIEEVLAFSINEISLLLHADIGGLFLLTHNNSKSVWNEVTKFGNLSLSEEYSEISVFSSEFQQTTTYLKEPLLVGKFNETKPIPQFYQEIMDEWIIQSAIILPLIVRNQGVGELWIGSHELNFFDEADIQIAFSVANQIAYIVDRNKLSLLTQEAVNENIEQEKLIDELQKLNLFGNKIVNQDARKIYDELLNSLLASIPDANSGWVGVINEYQNFITPITMKFYTNDLVKISFGENTLQMQSLKSNSVISSNEINFPFTYGLNEDQAVIYLNATQHQIPTSCVIAPIQTADKKFGILTMEIYDQDKSFSVEDESIIRSFIQQASLALNSAELIDSLKSQSLQMERLAELSKTITSNLNMETLRNSLLQQLKILVDFENATFWELGRNTLKIVATEGFKDNENREGIKVEVKDSLIFKELIDTQKAVVIHDANRDSRYPKLIEAENSSWLGIPLITQNRITGVIALEKKEHNFYTPSRIQIAQAFASQVAIALENASIFEESENRSQELDERSKILSRLNQFSNEINQLLDISQIYSLTAKSLIELMSCEMISIFYVRESGNVDLVFSHPAVQRQTFINQPFFEKLHQTGGVYQIPDIRKEFDIDFLKERLFESRNTISILFIPLLKSDKVFGWIGLESTTPMKYIHREVELGQTLTNQAAMAINNALLFQEIIGYKENLETRVQERTHELMIEHRNSEILLKISSELASSMDIEHIVTSTLRIINRSLGMFGSFIYINETKKTIQLLEHKKAFEKPIITEKLEKIITQVKTTKSVYLDNKILDDNFVIQHGSLLVIPIIFGEEVLGELAMFRESENFFNNRDVILGEAIAKQLSMALNNSEIFNLVREQSENLGVLVREQEVETTRSRAILEAVADGVLVTGNQGEIILLNKSGSDIFSIKKNTIEENIFGLQTHFGERVESWLSTIRNWTLHPNKIQRNTLFSERIKLDDEQVISIHLSPVIWQNEFLGTVSVFRDITYEVQIDELKSDFVSNISHELRTPLTSIKGYVEVLLLGASGSLNEQQRRFMEVIQNNTTRLNSLVDEILDVSRIESGQFQLSLEPIDIKALIMDAVHEQEEIFNQEKDRIKYQTFIADNLPKISIDKYRINQVLNNIFSNARNFSEFGGIIDIQAKLDDDTIKVSVKDSGIGLSKEDQKHAFERFYRGRSAVDVNSAGTGIGLSIAETLIKMHGGKIKLESSGISGEGTTVTFWLPISSKKVV